MRTYTPKKKSAMSSLAATQHAKDAARRACHVLPKQPLGNYRDFAHDLLALCRVYSVHLDPNEWGGIGINDGFDDDTDITVEFHYPGGSSFSQIIPPA